MVSGEHTWSSEGTTRIDKELVRRFGGEISRADALRWIRAGAVWIDGKLAEKASLKVSLGAHIYLKVPDIQKLDLIPIAMDLNILFEDEHLLVLNKKAGMVVHPAPSTTEPTLVHGLLHHCQGLSSIGGVERPGIVHRLDKDTSGALVVAKSDRAHKDLTEQFSRRAIQKRYQAWVWGTPPMSMRIETGYARHTKDRKRFTSRVALDNPKSKRAVTSFECSYRDSMTGVCILDIKIETGRTHQIRVHLSEAGFPIVGDLIYGRRGEHERERFKITQHALHATEIVLTHPVTEKVLTVGAPIPEALQQIVKPPDL